MSREEQNQLDLIGKDIGFLKRWWPIITGFLCFVFFLIGTTWKAADYVGTFVKKEEYLKALKSIEAINAKADLIKASDSTHYATNQQQIKELSERVERNGLVRNYTQYRDKDGNIKYKPYVN